MAYLKFNKSELVNLEYSLKREFLASNHSGGYTYTTIAGCNTRKYHGLLIVPVNTFGGDKHTLLSSIDETLIQHGKEFNLGIHQYGEVFEPRGHKYIVDFEIDKCVAVTYRVGGMLLRKVMLLAYNREQLFIQYTLHEAHSPTKLRLKPFLSFRNIHNLSRENIAASRRYEPIDNGCSFRMYEGFPDLNIQTNVKNEFISNPDWYYNLEYKEEARRMYDSKEDLYVPGYFELDIKKGQTILLSVSTQREKPAGFTRVFNSCMQQRGHRDSYKSCLKTTAKQFLVEREGDTTVYPGYPWMDRSLRDTLIALPGLTYYASGNLKMYESVLDTLVRNDRVALITGDRKADLPLWFVRSVQLLAQLSGEQQRVWSKYMDIIITIIGNYMTGSVDGVTLHENGLLWAEIPGVPLTWMDAVVNSMPVTEREGYQVEVNSLWYNALCFIENMLSKYGNSSSAMRINHVKDAVQKNFCRAFWIEDEDALADCVGAAGQDRSTRPNQLFACALDYSPLNDEQKAGVLRKVTKELLTTRGIRTLSPKNPLYKSDYDGDHISRDLAYHQGTARPWLLGFYIEASLKLYGAGFIRKAQELIDAFEEDMTIHCIASISEVYDGDPPHQPHGCTSYSSSVAELLRAMAMVEQYKKDSL